jgi:pentatricopeptide repeat protein
MVLIEGLMDARMFDEALRLLQEMRRTDPPGGHLKIPHPWPGQNPPPGGGGTKDDYAV